MMCVHFTPTPELLAYVVQIIGRWIEAQCFTSPAAVLRKDLVSSSSG
jgi:hypothetical protein